MSLSIKNVNGLEGQIDLVGVRAVVGIFYKWALERRGENEAGNPLWTFRAYFSYQKAGMLLSPKYKQVIKIKLPPDKWYEVRPGDAQPIIDSDEILRLEDCTLWPVQAPKQP